MLNSKSINILYYNLQFMITDFCLKKIVWQTEYQLPFIHNNKFDIAMVQSYLPTTRKSSPGCQNQLWNQASLICQHLLINVIRSRPTWYDNKV